MTYVKHLPPNPAGRDFVIGDLHGYRELLDRLMKKVSFDKTCDRLFSVGDIVDRGPDSPECLSLLEEPWFYAVRGNHEQMLVESVLCDDRLFDTWATRGGRWAQEWRKSDEIKAWAETVSRLPLVLVVGKGSDRFNVMHGEFFGTDAQLDAGLLSAQDREDILWGRKLARGLAFDPQHGLSLTFCGHSILPSCRKIGQQIFLDTGAFKGDGLLTMAEVVPGSPFTVKLYQTENFSVPSELSSVRRFLEKLNPLRGNPQVMTV